MSIGYICSRFVYTECHISRIRKNKNKFSRTKKIYTYIKARLRNIQFRESTRPTYYYRWTAEVSCSRSNSRSPNDVMTCIQIILYFPMENSPQFRYWEIYRAYFPEIYFECKTFEVSLTLRFISFNLESSDICLLYYYLYWTCAGDYIY